jgi:monofunctional glycosyltransferase
MVALRIRQFLAPVGRWALRLLLAALALVLCMVLLYRWINPPLTWLMLSESLRLSGIAQTWVPLEVMSPDLPRSAAAAEDANFCRHWGFDLAGIRAALADTSRLRGGSTISQQVAKNVFLWPDRSWTRKGLETGFTVLIEALWPKRRIMEVYLNVAEFDEGVFGVEAAARHYWGLDAAGLGPLRAGRLMAVLPAPKSRSPVSGDAWVNARGAQIQHGAATIRADGRADCFS